MGPLLVLILLFVVMYAAMIRPQQKRAREHQSLIAAVQVGDEVMTTAGIFGTVTAIDGDVISIEISPGTVMRVARAAIGRRMTAELDEYEAGETLDDVDDDMGASVADETPPTTGEPAAPEAPASTVWPPSPASGPSSSTPPTSDSPPAPDTPPTPGPGPGSAEPG